MQENDIRIEAIKRKDDERGKNAKEEKKQEPEKSPSTSDKKQDEVYISSDLDTGPGSSDSDCDNEDSKKPNDNDFKQLIREFIDKYPEITAPADHSSHSDVVGKTLLHKVAKTGSIKHAKLLLGFGLNVEARDEKGRTPLHCCAGYHGNIAVAKFLVKSGAPIEAEDYQGRTPLAVACKKGDLKLITFLLHQGASLQCVDKEGNNILDLALLSRPKVFNKIAPLFLNSPLSKQLTPLKKLDLYYQAAKNEWYKLANKLLRIFNIDIYTLNANGETLLFRTLLTDSILLELVQWLMDQGLAATINHRNNDGNTFLHYLAESSDENNHILKWLLQNVPHLDLNITNNEGATPLSVALTCNRIGTAILLVKQGANVNITPKRLIIFEQVPASKQRHEKNNMSFHVSNEPALSPLKTTFKYAQSEQFYESKVKRQAYWLRSDVLHTICEKTAKNAGGNPGSMSIASVNNPENYYEINASHLFWIGPAASHFNMSTFVRDAQCLLETRIKMFKKDYVKKMYELVKSMLKNDGCIFGPDSAAHEEYFKLLLESHIEQVSDLADPQEAINILELLISLPNQEIDDFIYKYPSKSAFFIRQVLLEDERSHWGIDTEKLCYDEQHQMFAIQIPSAFSQVRTGMLRQYADLQPGDIKLATFKLINAKIEEIKATIVAKELAEKQLRDRATKAEQQLQDLIVESDKRLQALKAENEKRLQDHQADKEKLIHDLQRENFNLRSQNAAAVVASDRELVLNAELNDKLKIQSETKPTETEPSNSSQNQELLPPTQPRSFSPLREHSLFRAARSVDGSQSGNGSDGNSARRVNSENNFPSRGTSANSSPVRISPDDESCASPLSVSSDDDASSSAHVSLTCVSSVIELPNSESSAINFSRICQVNQEDEAPPNTETTDERRVAP